MSKFSELLGKKILKIEGMKKDSDAIYFHTECGKKYKMYHDKDGFWPDVLVEDVCGNINNLLNTPILMAEKSRNENGSDEEPTQVWTFYKLATIKGFVDIRWFGEDDGYYSLEVDFEQVIP